MSRCYDVAAWVRTGWWAQPWRWGQQLVQACAELLRICSRAASSVRGWQASGVRHRQSPWCTRSCPHWRWMFHPTGSCCFSMLRMLARVRVSCQVSHVSTVRRWRSRSLESFTSSNIVDSRSPSRPPRSAAAARPARLQHDDGGRGFAWSGWRFAHVRSAVRLTGRTRRTTGRTALPQPGREVVAFAHRASSWTYSSVHAALAGRSMRVRIWSLIAAEGGRTSSLAGMGGAPAHSMRFGIYS